MDLFEYVAGCIRSQVWPRELVALHVLANGVIALAYGWIPATLLWIRKKRGDIPVDWTLLCFAGFILFCGFTHAMGVVTVWVPVYWFDGVIKAATGVVSIATAVLLQFRVLPVLLAIPNAETARLAREQAERDAEAARAATAEAERANGELRAALARVEAQDRAIRELSTPILPIWDGVLLSPIVGALDSSRAEQLVHQILDGVRVHRAGVVILDLTGVPVIDTQVANVLLRCSKAVGLLGARTVITGMQPNVAMTCVELDVNFEGLTPKSTLRDGLHAALAGKKGAT